MYEYCKGEQKDYRKKKEEEAWVLALSTGNGSWCDCKRCDRHGNPISDEIIRVWDAERGKPVWADDPMPNHIFKENQ